jgi:hypothetical protein
MKQKRFPQALIGIAVLLVLAAMLLFGMSCSKLLPTAPQEDQVQGYRAEDLWPAPPANLVSAYRDRDGSAKSAEFIGPAGGVVHFGNDFLELDLVVPPGALIERTLILGKAFLFAFRDRGDRSIKQGLRLDFKPDGLVFLVPARLQLKAKLLHAEEGDILILYWQNPNTHLWEVQQEVEVEDVNMEIEFDIYHFSRYAISR